MLLLKSTNKPQLPPLYLVRCLEQLHTYIHTLLARPHGAFQSMLYYNTLLNFKTQKAKHMTNIEYKLNKTVIEKLSPE